MGALMAEWMGGPLDGNEQVVPNPPPPRLNFEVLNPVYPISQDANAPVNPKHMITVSVPVGAWKGKVRLWWAGRNPRI